MVIAIIVLAWFGLAFGSFVNALVWRVHQQKKNKKSKELSIIKGRSMCPHCKHELAAKDLVPVFSWLTLKGRCRYCKKPISWQYPAVEVAGAAIFVLSYAFWPGGVESAGDWVLFTTWLLCSVGLLALIVYDIFWMLLPNRIIYPTFFIAAAGRLIYILGFSDNILHSLLMWVLSIAVASGIFYILFIISQGKWIGFGDIRLGFITGTLLATPALSGLMILLGSVIGTLFILPALLTGKKELASKLPFGPFLITATIILVLFGNNILSWYKSLFGLGT